MTTAKRHKILLVALIPLLFVALCGYWVLGDIHSQQETVYLHLDADDQDSLRHKLSQLDVSTYGLSILETIRPHQYHTGRYAIKQGESALSLYRKLRNGHQAPVNLTLSTARDLPKIVGVLTHKLMLDSLSTLQALENPTFLATYGYTKATLPSLFIPNTYEVYWDISLAGLMERLVKEHKRFWNTARMEKAQQVQLTPAEVSTLASIVDEETADDGEMPMIAELYLNRLRLHMPLQADPTIKAALGDWSIKRVLKGHLETDSPYNTYKNTGLPPGPISIPSIAAIDAVLNHAQHDYIYMCAKEDFSGRHNFAANYNEHLQNAKRYAHALSQRGIW